MISPLRNRFAPSRAALLAAAATTLSCGGGSNRSQTPQVPAPASTRVTALAEAVKPYLDASIIDSVVVGISVDGKTEYYSAGRGNPNQDSLFEIGSISKVYTGLLVADSVNLSKFELGTKLSALLPLGATAPKADNLEITVEHLLTHSSGLPRLPESIPATAADPYADYNEAMMFRDLAGTKLEFAPGSQTAYSNFAYGLLGHLVGQKLGKAYEPELVSRVLTPLGMNKTFIARKGVSRGKLIEGRDDDLQPKPPWQWDVLAPAGGIVSSAADQMKFVQAHLAVLTATGDGKGVPESLRKAITTSAKPLRMRDEEGGQAYSWVIDRDGRHWHNGGTAGFHSFIGFDPKKNLGVVVLAATSSSLVDKLAIAAFAIAAGEPRPPAKFPSAEALRTLSGTFRFDMEGLGEFAMEANGNRFYIADPAKGKLRLIPLNESEFLLEALGAIIAFRDPDNIVVVIEGKPLPAKRVKEP